MVSPLGIVAETPAQVQGRVLIFRLAVVINCVCAIETMEVRMTEKRSNNFFIFYNDCRDLHCKNTVQFPRVTEIQNIIIIC